MSDRRLVTTCLFLSSSNLMASLERREVRGQTGWHNLHWVEGVLQTEGDVVEVSVGAGTLRDCPHVVLVGGGH